MAKVTIDLREIYGETAKLDNLWEYREKVWELAGEGNDVTLTGPAPVWLYLFLAHALHGKCRRLSYDSPASGPVTIFDHNPFQEV